MATSMIKVAKAISSNPGTTKKIVLTRLIPTAIEALTKNNCDVVYYDSTDEKIPYDVLEAIVGPDVDGIFCLLTDTIDENIINKSGDNLKVISTLSVGFDHLDIATCTKKNIRVGNTPRVLDVATAEIAFSLMFNVFHCFCHFSLPCLISVTQGPYSRQMLLLNPPTQGGLLKAPEDFFDKIL